MIFKINTYSPITGIREPLIIVMPQNKTGKVQSQETEKSVREIDSLVSLLDIMPTILEWHNNDQRFSNTCNWIISIYFEYHKCIIYLVKISIILQET